MDSHEALLDLLNEIPDPRRAEGMLYKLPYILLFSILAVVTGADSFRGIVTFIHVHRVRLNAAFGLNWKRAPAHTAVRYILQGLNPQAVEQIFRRQAASLQPGGGGHRAIALDGKTLRRSFDHFNDRKAAQLLHAFDTGSDLLLAHAGTAGKSNEIPAAQKLLGEPGIAHRIVTLDALHCQKNVRGSRRGASPSHRSTEGQSASLVAPGRGRLRRAQAARNRHRSHERALQERSQDS